MPKELFEIKQFQTGTVTTPAERDLPPDAASHSLNIDPISVDGKLQGMSEDQYMVAASGWANTGTILAGFDADYMSVLNDSGTRRLVFYDADANQYHKVDDIDATSSVSVDTLGGVLSSSNISSAVPNNNELHIGRGGEESIWVGFPQYKQFGTDYSSTMQLESAELKSPSVMDNFYKVVTALISGVRYFYAVKWKGNYIYKFAQTGADAYTLVSKSGYRFGQIQGLALRYKGITDAASDAFLWVYDASVGANGTLYAYDGVATSTGFSVTLEGGPSRSGNVEFDSGISDISEGKDDVIWFAKGYDGSKEFKDDIANDELIIGELLNRECV